MEYPDDPGTSPSVSIDSGDIRYVVDRAGDVAEMLEDAQKLLSGTTDDVGSGMSGWSSATVLKTASNLWATKTGALTRGEGGLTDFGETLTRFQTDAVAADADTRDDVAASLESELGNRYFPQAAEDQGDVENGQL